MEGIVLERVGTLGLFCPKLGQGFRPSVAALYPSVLNVMHGEVNRIFFLWGRGGGDLKFAILVFEGLEILVSVFGRYRDSGKFLFLMDIARTLVRKYKHEFVAVCLTK